ncbi:NAD-glutamate dehydrogenase [Spiribacter halobius]|uniref:NAD-glutamate dehydrogenase n=1 Tax=Sediminicurvatus halobius TaxID=2182432 RepID=A0A2U2MZG3_9GAMM|nr:NAD-glutamate dehydrogenase [Spiribacter halobius]PWG62202.1 NAD-glutamate dehydrogenase [Spiribacter halobius]UEX78108.1 NAD-glutamate dehydrogenase [Spiribacter halobius]
MKNGSDNELREAAIEATVERVRERWSQDQVADVERFVRIYYAGLAPEDIGYSDVGNLYGAALSHWTLGGRRTPGQPLIHVYNPDPEQNGWECTHSVVQIVTDDRPFLVDSLSMALNRHGLTIHLIIHPVLTVARDGDRLTGLLADGDRHGVTEAWMHFEVDRQSRPERLQAIHDDLRAVLEDVEVTVADWKAMRGQVDTAVRALRRNPPGVDGEYVDEVVEFLRWVAADHFTFLGYRRYDLRQRRGRDVLQAVADSGLGLLRDGGSRQRISASFDALPDDLRSRARDPDPLVLTKSSSRATVHRPGYMDYIGVKRYNARGEVIGEHRFLGLYTSAAYNRNPRTIPLLRRKVEAVLARADLRPNSHAGKALVNIIETYPRDELFQSSVDELYATALGILQLQERQRVRLFVRYDPFGRFVSCLVYAPRERYNTEVRQRMQEILAETFDAAHSEFSVQLSEAVLARIHFIVHLRTPGRPAYDHAALERRIADTMRSWSDDLYRALLEHYGEERGTALHQRYGDGFGAAYREDTSPRAAALDIERLETLHRAGDLSISLYRPLEAPEGTLRFKLFHAEQPITLSDVLPVLEHMGVQVVDERPYDIEREDDTPCWIHDFGLAHEGAGTLDTDRVREAFQEAFAAVWRHEAEDDGFNRLVLAAGLGWRDIVILRAYAHYLRQAGTSYSQAYVEETLAANPDIAASLVALFRARLDPERRDDARAERLAETLEGALEAVASLDEDRILRRLLAAVQATLRSNYFRRDGDGRARGYLAFKLRPDAIPGVPKPVPAYEIFVYSPRVEGVHLRGGKVARGGLRWSDRREDFRTEVLGLMKAQMVKNAVIVPVGAKGGFVCKHLPEERSALQAEVLECYRTFIRALLDVTDNIVEGAVVPPPDVVRHDDDDPYLVVAADKGTATFSDDANAVAEEYGFWLRDAFASGGSSGYDHKKMGITARGAWEAVKRHFRELGRDIQREPFSVVGVGDMSGDVFGNGMLLSRQIRLIGAFDHRHIFLDPDPDPETSYVERERLFGLDRSTWADYDTSLISRGGGVWPRSAKSIPLSKESRAALGIEASRLTPAELISAILRAPVDLLWNGGIGTYVKAAEESDADVGDKTNDAVRVDAEDLRCKVIGEGGNLGITQLGRVAFALGGGRVNSDAIDNSGGVDCSDHEVNIKILVNRVVDDGDLTLKQRNRLLRDMTDEVASLVLANNYRQTQGLSLMEARAAPMLDEHGRFMRELERAGRLDRLVEKLPDDDALGERNKLGQGLTRPELAVLLAYSKLQTYEGLLDSALVASEELDEDLLDYFPRPVRERFPERVTAHPLRREIIATSLTNHILNRMGATFLFRLGNTTGCGAEEAARAYLAARDIYGLRGLWHEVDRLDNQAPAALQAQLLQRICHLQERATVWLLRNAPPPLDIGETIGHIRPAVSRLESRLEELLAAPDREHLAAERDGLVADGVPEALAGRVSRLEPLFAVLDLVKACTDTGAELEETARLYFEAGRHLGLDGLRTAIAAFRAADPWQERYRAGLEEEFFVQQRLVTVAILGATGPGDAEARVAEWSARHANMVERLGRTMEALQATPQPELAMLGVGLQELRQLSQVSAAEGGGSPGAALAPAREAQG